MGTVRSMLPALQTGDPLHHLQKSMEGEAVSPRGVASGWCQVGQLQHSRLSNSYKAGSPDGGPGSLREWKILPKGTAHVGQVPGYFLGKPNHRRLRTGPDISRTRNRASASFPQLGSPEVQGLLSDLNHLTASYSSPQYTLCFSCRLLQGHVVRENHVSTVSALPTAKIILKKASFLDEQNYSSYTSMPHSPS